MTDHKPKLYRPPTCFGDLPNCLLVEVLHRLPLIAAHRSKLVCKRWCSVISEPYFASRFSQDDKLSFLFFVCYDLARAKSLCLSDSYRYHLNANMSLDFVDSDVPLIVEASCNDLMLCRARRAYYLVCNPVTREISERFPLMPMPSPGSQRTEILTGFTSKKNGEFAVVTMISYGAQNNPEIFIIWGLSSNELAWFTIPCHPRIKKLRTLHKCAAPIPHKGMLFWYSRGAIFGIDPFNVRVENPWLFVELPQGFIQTNNFTEYLGECRQNLRLCQLFGETGDSDLVLRVWDLKDPSDWTLHRHLSLQNLVETYELSIWTIRVEHCHPNDPEIVHLGTIFRGQDTILSLNMLTYEAKIECLRQSDETHRRMSGVTPYTIQWQPTRLHRF